MVAQPDHVMRVNAEPPIADGAEPAFERGAAEIALHAHVAGIEPRADARNTSKKARHPAWGRQLVRVIARLERKFDAVVIR